MRSNKKSPLKSDKTQTIRTQKRGVVGYSRKTALLEEAITQMNAGKYGRSSAALKELLALDPVNMEARRLFATLHLRLGSLIPAKQAFDSLITEAFQRQDYWLAESLLREYLAAGPRCVPFLEKLGSIYQEKGDALEAVAEYGKAIDILIEDPDPENPLHAAELYAKIRELAPASPVAFRVASFFDAETGELLVRKSSHDEAPTTAPAPEIEGDGQSKQAHPESVSAAMPWDVQDPPEIVELPSETAHSSELPSPSTESVNTDLLVQDAQRHDQGVASPGVSAVAPAEHNLCNVQNEVAENAAVQESGTPPAAQGIHVLSEPGAAGSPQSSALPTESTVETPMQPEADPVAPVADASTHQKLEQLSATASSESSSVDSATAPVVAQLGPETGSESSSGPLAGGSDVSVTSPLQPEVKPVSTLPSTASSRSESIQEPDRELSASQTVTHDNVRTEEFSGPSDASRPSQTLASENSEPWKQAGFSWESVFNSAWKFNDLPPAKDSPPEPVPTRLEEAVVEAQAASSPQEQPVESSSIEIPERDTQSPSHADVATGSSITPMPWDQVEEATISIQPAQAEPPIAEDSVPACLEETPVEAPAVSVLQGQQEDHLSIEIPEREAQSPSQADVAAGSSPAPMPWDQVQKAMISIIPAQADPPPVENREPEVDRSPAEAEPNRTPTDDEFKSQPPSLPSHVIAEPESFSFAQDLLPSHSSEQPHAVDGTGETSAPIGGTDRLAEPEPTFRLASPSTIEQPPTLQEPAGERELPIHASEPTVATLGIQEEARTQDTDVSLNAEETSATVLPETVTQKSETESLPYQSQSVEEIASATSEEIQPSRLAPPEQAVAEPVLAYAETSPVSQKTPTSATREDQSSEASSAELRSGISESVPPQEEEWVKRSASIRFVQDQPVVPVAPAPQPISQPQDVSRPLSVAAAAVDVLFESSQQTKTTETRERAAESKPPRAPSVLLPRIRVAISNFVHSCFSTTRAIVATLIGLVVLSGLFVALGTGAIALTWVIMEEPPAPAFQSFTTIPQQTLSDSKKNAYTILMGLEASAGQDSLQAGSHETSEARDSKTALTCFGAQGSETGDRSNASASVLRGWVRRSDPVGQFKANQETIKGWGSRNQMALERYSQWQKLPFEDWGYGRPGSPPCAAMAFTHQLYVADGFVQGTDIGVDRLETDMETWRAVLGQARTLPVKMLALQAVNDDIAVASGMLARPDFDGKYLGRITKFLRPLDQGELSMRWPMQSELVSASKTYDGQLKAVRADDQSIYTTVASMLPLPKQRRLNDYAEYYEASYKAAGEKQYGSLPKWKDYFRFPAAGMTDYLTNPIENVVGLEPLPAWDLYNGLTVDTDAHLRLASLQAWLRRGSSESDLLTRIAKAGQGFYDPYTGLPMLVNMKKGVLYSVGHDGKDQDADPQLDVVVDIPLAQTSPPSPKPSATSSKSR